MESMHMKFFINNSVTPKHWVGHFVFFVVVIFGLTVNPVKGEDVALSNLPETEINLQDTPKKIMAALRDRLPNFKISAVYEIRDDEKKILRYDFEGRRLKDKKDVIVSFSGDAKFIKIND